MTTPPRILLTGKSGQLGSELCAKLAPLGEVVATDRTTLDLARTDTILPTVLNLQPTLIVNAAAYTAVDRAESEPEQASAINALAPNELAKAACELGAPMIHYSTDYVFNGSATSPYEPDAPTDPINFYGQTKARSESMIASRGAQHVILRTSWVYAMTGRNFVRAILSRAEQGEPLRVVNDQQGSPTWAHDLAVGTTQIARQILHGTDGRDGIYHLTGSGITTWYDFACAIVELADLPTKPTITPVPTSEFPTKAKRPAYSALNCTSTEKVFGVKLPHWRDAIERAMKSR